MKIKHINHSSLLLQCNQGNYLLCDPWIISSAFTTWVQNPKPTLKTVEQILNTDKNNINVLISHGHDDHLDEFVLKKHFNEKDLFIPKLRSPGLKNRIKGLDCLPVEIGEKKHKCGGFEISNIINEDFTGDDTIFMINDDEHLVIHANDNYHYYNKTLLDQIKNKSKDFKKEKIFYFVQRGIADAYPMSYANYDDKKVSELIKNRYKTYCETIETNRKNLALDKVLIYANQAKIIHDIKREDWLFSAHEQIISLYANQKQLYPDNIISDNNTVDYKDISNVKTYYKKCFEKYQEIVNIYLKDVISKDIYMPIKFYDKFFDDYKEHEIRNEIEIVANPNIWNEIFSGKITIESITIGGAGIVNKPLDYNLSKMFHSLTKISYKIKMMINRDGLEWINLNDAKKLYI